MKNYKEMTFDELAVARREANDKLGELYTKCANREFKAEEAQEELNLTRELRQINEAMQSLNRQREHENALGDRRTETISQQFRELLQDNRSHPGKAEREITLASTGSTDYHNVDASGAINLTIHDMIPTLHEGLGLPVGLNMVTGVVGNELWPVSVDDVELEEVGEVDSLTDQVLDFNKITPTSRRTGLTVPVSNRAIDNAAFDLLAFVQGKFTLAVRKYLAEKIYSRALWEGNKGPFSNMKASGVITIGSTTYKQILKAVAEFSNNGFFEGNVCISMDRVTEAELMSTPKIAGAAAGFCIENGKCCGYDYTVSHYVNTEFNASGKLVAGSGRYLCIGYWEWFALQQHDTVRMSIDATSQAVAKKNITAVTLNTAWSMTDLSVYINGANNTTQAFATYAVMTDGTNEVLLSQHVVTIAAGDTFTVSAVTNLAGATISYASSATGKATVTSAGVITGVAAGTATITVTASDGTSSVTDTIAVTVTA